MAVAERERVEFVVQSHANEWAGCAAFTRQPRTLSRAWKGRAAAGVFSAAIAFDATLARAASPTNAG